MNKYILMQALTGSEWDSVEFALLPYSLKRIKNFLDKKASLEGLKKSEGIDELITYADEVDFYNDAEQLPERIEFESGDESPMIVELTDEEVASLSQPEQVIKYGEVSIGTFEVKFSGFGKHTSEEYWCRINWDNMKKFESIK
jgi:glycyl-tRNA synthetase alpha subunit